MTFTAVIAGNASSFDEDAYRAALAQMIGQGVRPEDIILTHTPGSTRVTAHIVPPPTADIDAVHSTLTEALSTPAAASSALGIPVASTTSPTQVAFQPDSSASSSLETTGGDGGVSGSTAAIVAATCVIALVLVLLGYWVNSNKSVPRLQMRSAPLSSRTIKSIPPVFATLSSVDALQIEDEPFASMESMQSPPNPMPPLFATLSSVDVVDADVD